MLIERVFLISLNISIIKLNIVSITKELALAISQLNSIVYLPWAVHKNLIYMRATMLLIYISNKLSPYKLDLLL